MYISPPVAVPILLAVGIALAASFAPAQKVPSRITVNISEETYERIVHWSKVNARPDGKAMTVDQVIEAFVSGHTEAMKQ